MGTRSYDRLSIEDFGKHLLDTGDLDPVYIALHKMELDQNHLHRWLIAYWCFYHCGAASVISENEGAAFWEAMKVAAVNATPAPNGERWPRGSERRHFRGEAAKKAVTKLWGKFMHEPQLLVEQLAHGLPEQALPYRTVADRALELPLFGPWIAFKVCDMLDRLGIRPVAFDNAAIFMFDSPRKNAVRIFKEKAGIPEAATLKDEDGSIQQVVDYLTKHFADAGYLAPPLYDRPVDLQEIETILCKHGSHLSGHYPLFNDIREINHGLASWAPHSETAKLMLACMPKEAA